MTFDLPTNKESGYLKIYQDGELIFQDTIICTSNGYPYVVYANGETRIQAYLDDELIYDRIITVDGNNE